MFSRYCKGRGMRRETFLFINFFAFPLVAQSVQKISKRKLVRICPTFSYLQECIIVRLPCLVFGWRLEFFVFLVSFSGQLPKLIDTTDN